MIQSLTPVLHVDRIEPVLPFWVDRLGFTLVAEVPHDGAIGFVILQRDGVELMYQTRASIAADVPAALGPGNGHSVGLYLAVADLDEVMRALADLEPVVPRRRTFYGADEIGWREPGGHVVLFARQAPAPAGGSAA
ncbi:MAG TPA: VOC family protein [Gemmatirosa sp.]|nr:VOC family protein [Gemmatirosa sp.]